jgi:hypothetical protein
MSQQRRGGAYKHRFVSSQHAQVTDPVRANPKETKAKGSLSIERGKLYWLFGRWIFRRRNVTMCESRDDGPAAATGRMQIDSRSGRFGNSVEM